MFKGRKEELETLESMHGSGNFEFAVVYGRRRVGKTTLIRRFCEGKRAFYFVARESSASENLKLVRSSALKFPAARLTTSSICLLMYLIAASVKFGVQFHILHKLYH